MSSDPFSLLFGTTHYEYYPAGVLGAGKQYQVIGPFTNSTITYVYDQLGRVTSQDINGAPMTTHYDSLGRVDLTGNSIGSFDRAYDGVTTRLKTMNYRASQGGAIFQTSSYDYFGNDNDRRLQRIKHTKASSAVLSQHEYDYDPEGQIQDWSETLGSGETDWALSYDDAKQLTGVTVGDPRHDHQEFSYQYDAAGNRLLAAVHTIYVHHSGGGELDRIYTANNLNQLDSIASAASPGFESSNPVAITYDTNGNMTFDGSNQTFEWDGADRLAAINYLDTGGRTEFAYDGLGRRVKITEYNGVVGSTIQPATDGNYAPFTSAAFTVATGNYTLIFQGLNPDGGNNMMLIDGVKLGSTTLVTNGGFESPILDPGEAANGGGGDTSWAYDPSNAGIAVSDSYLAIANPAPPDGSNQVGFIEENGFLSQTVAIPTGTYTLNFSAAQSLTVNQSSQAVRVALRGAVASVKTFVWCGNTICEERDATGANVTKRFFAEGEQRVGGTDAGNYYYTRDHLGSVREVTDSTGVVKAEFDYDLWGNQVVVSGSMSIDFGFTGHYFHQPSGLYLAMYRAYNPTLGRWISRDPLNDAEMNQGPNLYDYVGNDPVSAIDLLGLYTQAQLDAAREIALSGLSLRRQQLVALQNGDLQQWAALQGSKVSQGNSEAPLHHNAPLDEWEASPESQENARQNNALLSRATSDSVLSGGDKFWADLQLTEDEALRQILFLRWLNNQKADAGCP